MDNSDVPSAKSPCLRSASVTSLAPGPADVELGTELGVEVHQVSLDEEDTEDAATSDEGGLGRNRIMKKCPICFESIDERSFKRHLGKHDEEAANLACNLCGRKFGRRLDNLMRHKRERCPRYLF